ncbi:MAG TPA: hypothetical protein P5050_02315 [Bacteroidia bacterium]|nr:hypothetical protein [Bacteroidia bacterium]HRU68861.1 hypothetical protein [Bacteroidia bacterium]
MTSYQINNLNLIRAFSVAFSILIMILMIQACDQPEIPKPEPSDNLSIDSLVTTKSDLVIWEKAYITAYTRGKNLKFKWTTNHGSMLGRDSNTVTYWACPSCIGINTVKCTVTNEYGTVSDTIAIKVRLK